MAKIRQGGCWLSENRWRQVSGILAQSRCAKSFIATHDRRGCLTRRQPPKRTFAACAVLAALCFVAALAWPQATCIVPTGVDTNPTGTSFFSSFANPKYNPDPLRKRNHGQRRFKLHVFRAVLQHHQPQHLDELQ
jgi:hypothetical protein